MAVEELILMKLIIFKWCYVWISNMEFQISQPRIVEIIGNYSLSKIRLSAAWISIKLNTT